MNLTLKCGAKPVADRAAFTLIDVVLGVAISALMFVTLYLGLSQGFSVIQVARENLRATQIMQEKMETTWLYTWNQINSTGFIPSTFQAPFYPTGPQSGQGITYQGTLNVSAAPVTESYADSLRQVVVTVNWQSGTVQHTRQMTALVSQYGLHNYIY